MPAGKYLYRVLRDDEDPSKGLSARNPEAVDAKVSSHVNGLKKSPYISTTASKKAAEAYYWLAVKQWQKKNKSSDQKTFQIARINKDKLLEENEDVELYDLSDPDVREKYLANQQKLKNYAKKYEEVLIKGFIPASCVEEFDLFAMSDVESLSSGYEVTDYTSDDMEDIIVGASDMKLK